MCGVEELREENAEENGIDKEVTARGIVCKSLVEDE